MTVKMKAKFDKYWRDLNSMNLVIFVACVFDPRFKMKYVSWLIQESYGSSSDSIVEALIEKVEKVVEKIFKYYEDRFDSYLNQTPSQAEGITTSSQGIRESAETYDLESLIVQRGKSEENSACQSELENYLGESCVPIGDKHFNVLLWWKNYGSRYRILSQMARDLLAIPISSVASESAFFTSGRVIDSQRSSLTPRIVEALHCTQDWIQSDYEPPSLENQFEQLEIIEEEFVNSNEYGKLVKGVNLFLEEEE